MTTVGKGLLAFADYNRDRQICATERRAKNLAIVAREEPAQREGTLSQQKIVDFMCYMKKNGLAESTIKCRVKLIKRLAKLRADLYDPENVKEVIASQKWTNGRKDFACDAYATFLALTGGTWERPKYEIIDKEPFIPQPSEVKQLIAGCSPRMACFLQVLSETAWRPGELWQSAWKDYDQPTRTVRVTPEKGSKSGTYKISKELATMLEALPRKYGDRVFSTPNMDLDHHRGSFCRQRKRIASKLKNPRLMMISFKTLRHFKGTLEAWRTNNPFIVQEFLRHRNIKNTMRYIHLAQLLFKNEKEYFTEVARNADEARRLIERGWTYITGEYGDGGKIFAKPKDPLASDQ
jgi:integrase